MAYTNDLPPRPGGLDAQALDRLRELDPDALTPKEALDALYALKSMLGEKILRMSNTG